MTQYFKGLRPKILLSLAAGMLILFALLFFVARYVLLDGYAQLEKDKVLLQMHSATGLLNEQVDQLSSVTRDYAHWDDAYEYMEKRNPSFVESNLNDTTFANLKINAIILIDANGKAIFKKGLNYETATPWHIPDLLLRALLKDGELADHSVKNISGLFWTKQGVCIVSRFDVLDSNLTKGTRGNLVFIRLLDEPLKDKIGKILNAKVSIEGMRDDEIFYISPTLAKNKPVVIPLNDKQVAGFALVDTIGSDAKLVLNTVSDRKIFNQGKSNLKFMFWAAAAIALLLAAFSWLLDKLVLARLTYLSSSVDRLGETTAMSGRVATLVGDDEMANLANGINSMLERIDESRHALQLEKDRAQVTLSTLSGIAEAVITSNDLGHVVYMNAAAESLTGISIDEVGGRTLRSLLNLMTVDKTSDIDVSWLTEIASNQEEAMLIRADGQEFIIRKSTSPLYDNQNILFGYVTVLHDVTALRELSNQLFYQAKHDALTGLVNRYEFDRKVQEAILDVAFEDRSYCLAYIDLDQFKIVNDTSGHMAGDLLLQQLANHLKANVRSSDTFARLGGDEFALLLNGCDIHKGQEIVNEMLNAVIDYRFSFDDKVFKVGASIGLVELTQHNRLNLSELLNAVDSACYKAKRDGGNRIHIYQHEGNDLDELHQRLNWVPRIHQALEKNQFVLHMQTIQSLKADAEQHCELLIRMQDEEDKLYLPGNFLPVAERYHLMPQIDRWVVAEALTIIARKGESFPYVCAINLSGQTISDEHFLAYVLNQFELHNINPRRICFEITETAVISNLGKAQKFMQALRALGCRFSLDDFGSGLSSFGYLKNLEVDFLKIDGIFVKNMINNKIDRAMVESINHVGHVMGLRTIAEFVENDDTINLLKEIGVDYVQGYGVAKPALLD
jgi:diguanylate cyclase (GGDEF)-like protein/PAS domain S-box-containing protein